MAAEHKTANASRHKGTNVSQAVRNIPSALASRSETVTDAQSDALTATQPLIPPSLAPATRKELPKKHNPFKTSEKYVFTALFTFHNVHVFIHSLSDSSPPSMTEDEREEVDDGGQANSMAINTLEDEADDFVPPNPTSIIISPYNTIIDPTRLYFIAVGRGVTMAAKFKTFIRQSSDDQLTTLCSWWNPQSKQWESVLYRSPTSRQKSPAVS